MWKKSSFLCFTNFYVKLRKFTKINLISPFRSTPENQNLKERSDQVKQKKNFDKYLKEFHKEYLSIILVIEKKETFRVKTNQEERNLINYVNF